MGNGSRDGSWKGGQGEMYDIFLIRDTSTGTGNCRAILIGKKWDSTEEALFLSTAAAAVTAGVGVSIGLRTAMIKSLNGLDLD